MADMITKTARLLLRPLVMADVEDMTRLIGEIEVSRWLTVVPHPYGLADARQFIGKIAGKGDRAIEIEGAFAGVVGLSNGLGYWLGRPYWRNGYMTEAVSAAVANWFEVGGGDLSSGYFIGNEGSKRILSGLGFEPTVIEPTVSVATGQENLMQKVVLTRADWLAANTIHIETDRLVIRDLRDGDWHQLQRIAGVPEVAAMMRNISAPWPEADVREWLEMSKWRGMGRTGFRLGVTLRDGTLIGTCGFRGDAEKGGISYFLGLEYWGQGFATEAMHGFLNEIFGRYGTQRIHASHFNDNPASGRVLCKLGFSQTGQAMGSSDGRLEDAPETLYRLTRTQFEARP